MSAKRSILYLTIILFLLQSIPVYAQENFYYVYDADNPETVIEEFNTYESASSFFSENRDEYENLIIADDKKIIRMEYGTVEFHINDACAINIEYHSEYRNEDDYLNGCYGIDGAYISTSANGSEVYFMISDDYGVTDIDNVDLRPYSDEKKVSVYTIRNDKLIHNIKTQAKIDYYTHSLILDNRPAFLNEGKNYFSYDGHYFYDDFYQMIDDYRNEERIGALNSKGYFNYFEFLPHRSMSEYNASELEEYFYNTLGLNSRMSHYLDVNMDNANDEVNRSQFYDIIDEFFINQNLYGANALMMIASAINESGYGKSYNAFASNNLYNNAAYDSQVENTNNRYNDVASSIYSHAKYFISSLYSNHLRDSYSGTFFGNKASGINVNYSLDTYYGEKNAALCFELDSSLSGKDYNNYAIALINNVSSLRLYSNENLDDRLFTINDVYELSYVVLAEYDEAYKISIDYSFSDDYLYDFSRSVAYIDKDDVDLVLNKDKIREREYTIRNYDFNGGTYHDYEKISMSTLDEADSAIIPYKEGYEFVSYNENNEAIYREIKEIKLLESSDEDFEYGQQIDLSRWNLEISYTDGSDNKIIPVNTDMVSYYDINNDSKQIIVITYCGKKIEKEIVFSKEDYEIRQIINKALNEEDFHTIKDNIGKLIYPLSFSEIRTIDYYLKENNGRNYVIEDHTGRYNFSISGLDLSLADYDNFKFIEDTYYITLRDINEDEREKIYNLAEGYGFSEVEGIDIAFRFNYQNIELNGPAIVQIAIADKRNDLVYSVYHLNDNGDIIKCRTTQSDNYIQFLIYDDGPYLVLSKQSENEYLIADKIEDLSYENMGYDNHRINFTVMSILVLTLAGLIGITFYYIIYNKRKRLWRDFKKLLPIEDFVQEEKPKN